MSRRKNADGQPGRFRGWFHSIRVWAARLFSPLPKRPRLTALPLRLESLEEIWRQVVRTGELTLAQRMQIRLQSTWAIHQAKAVGDIAYHAAGDTAIFDANPYERRFRDLNTVTQQLQGREAHYETVGQFLLGLDADTTWL